MCASTILACSYDTDEDVSRGCNWTRQFELLKHVRILNHFIHYNTLLLFQQCAWAGQPSDSSWLRAHDRAQIEHLPLNWAELPILKPEVLLNSMSGGGPPPDSMVARVCCARGGTETKRDPRRRSTIAHSFLSLRNRSLIIPDGGR